MLLPFIIINFYGGGVNVLAVSYLAETQEIPRIESCSLKEVVSETEGENMSRNYIF